MLLFKKIKFLIKKMKLLNKTKIMKGFKIFKIMKIFKKIKKKKHNRILLQMNNKKKYKLSMKI